MRSLLSLFLCISIFLIGSVLAEAEVKKNKKVASNVYSLKRHEIRVKNSSLDRFESYEGEGDVTFIKHKVKKGETLLVISKKYGVGVEEIKAVNGLKNKRVLPGMTILIPRETEEREEEIVEVPKVSYGKWKDPDERHILVKVAKSFVGAPYKLGGNTVKGLDCSAFVKKIFEIFDVDLPRTAREQYLAGKRIEKEELAVGDLVFFKTRPGKQYPTHVGIYIGEGKFIHASSHRKSGVRIDSLDTPFYRRTYVGAVRIKESPDSLAESKDLTFSAGNL